MLVAEDVPQVSQHIRNLLSVQSQVQLLEVLGDGSKVLEAVTQLRPDAVMVDLLLCPCAAGMRVVCVVRTQRPHAKTSIFLFVVIVSSIFFIAVV